MGQNNGPRNGEINVSCNYPISGYQKIAGGWSPHYIQGQTYFTVMEVPCGRCTACRLAKASMWATRIMQEAQCYDNNSFITLTYNDIKKPINGSVKYDDLQRFFKRFRNATPGDKRRYYAVSEYGSITSRPHYHACIFNYWPSDCQSYKKSATGQYYTSETLEKIWGNGFVVIGELTWESAAYVASYVTDKILGSTDKAKELREYHLQGKEEEKAYMSRRPGIGADFYKMFDKEIHSSGTVLSNGKEVSPSRFFKEKWRLADPVSYENWKNNYKFTKKSRHEENMHEDYLLAVRRFFSRENIIPD